MTDALIHMRVPAATKARWVRESRAAGMRLTDWIVQRVEAQPMKKITPISIPLGMTFADLRLARDPKTGDVFFDQEARQASAFRPGKDSAKPVRASLGANDQSAAVVREHQPCELFPIARA